MAIWSTEASSGELTIKIQGRFDFSAHQEFRDAYEKVSEDPKGYIVVEFHLNWRGFRCI